MDLKRLNISLLQVIFALGGFYSVAAGPTSDLVLSIATDKRIYHENEDIWMTISIANKPNECGLFEVKKQADGATEEMNVGLCSLFMTNTEIVINKRGRKSKLSKGQFGGDPERFIDVVLAPGEVTSIILNLNCVNPVPYYPSLNNVKGTYEIFVIYQCNLQTDLKEKIRNGLISRKDIKKLPIKPVDCFEGKLISNTICIAIE